MVMSPQVNNSGGKIVPHSELQLECNTSFWKALSQILKPSFNHY